MKRLRILVAVDEKAASAAAVRVAAAIAAPTNARVSVLHVHEPGYRDGGPDSPESRASRLLVDSGIPALIEVRSGEPAWEILAAARTLRADLLVMGSRGRSSVAGALLGSVSQEVVGRSKCPVLLVREDSQTAQAPYSIVLGVEGLAGLKSIVDITGKLAVALAARVYAVHVDYPGGEEVERAAYHAPRSHGEQALAAVVKWLSAAGIEVHAESLASRAGVARAIVKFASDVGADLIVIGVHHPEEAAAPAEIGEAVAVAHLARQPVLAASEGSDPR